MSCWCSYYLRSEENPNLTYVGMTNNLARRLRQHNGELVGGAKYTSTNRPWKLAAVITNLESKSQALRVEYYGKAKNYRRGKYSSISVPNSNSVQRRVFLIKSTMLINKIPKEKLIIYDEEFAREYLK